MTAFDDPREVVLWLRIVLLIGFFLQIVVTIWAVVTVTRIKRELQIAALVFDALAERAGMKVAIDKIQASAHMRRGSDRAKAREARSEDE